MAKSANNDARLVPAVLAADARLHGDIAIRKYRLQMAPLPQPQVKEPPWANSVAV
jgi:hypothetical protein